YQVATLRDDPKMNPGPNTILRHSAVPHFDQSDDDNPTPIPASEVVLWLLSHQGYALGGRITNSSDSVYAAHLVNGLVVLLRGRNLFETLVYSMPIYNQTKPFVYLDSAFDTDIPAWEQPTPVQAKRIPYGWLDVLTWQSRRVLLLPEWIDQQWKVRRVIVSGGYDLDDRAFRDPMQFQRTTKDGPRLLKMNVDRATWRDLMPCLAAYTTNDSKEDGIGGVIKPDVLDELEEMSNSAHVRIQVIGIGNDKGKMEIWRQEIVNVSAQIFTNTTMQIAIEQALQACKNGELCMNTAMYVYAEEMLKRGGARKIRTEDITGYAHSLGWRVYYWGNLEQLYTEHVLYRLEALLAITDPEALAEQVSQITRIWFDTLVAYIQTVYGTSANAGLHAHGLHALSVGERALIASFYKYGLRRKEVNDE
ncbi:MAG: type I-E CRISPR-associated protein Cse1/CasA, partial [Roseiflexaceae bacterium]